jgi:hypothetical protein
MPSMLAWFKALIMCEFSVRSRYSISVQLEMERDT